jgi:NAD(P)H-quinone oxidoreductase subunit 4L
MTITVFLIFAAALFAVGLYGLLSQQSIVMIMMGLELAINGVIVAASAVWYFAVPGSPDAQTVVLVAITAMAVEMAIGFAVTTAIFRSRDVDTVDSATDLKG